MNLDNFAQHYSNASVRLPLILTAPESISRSESAELIREGRVQLLETVSNAGAVLLRGLGHDSSDDNQKILHGLAAELLSYKGGGSADRKNISENVSTVTPSPALVQIPLHNELSYTENYPRYMCFFCHTSPKWGGATSLADGNKVYESIEPALKTKLERHGVCYKRFMYHNTPKIRISVRKSWQQTFLTDDRTQVERELENDNIEYQWTNSGLSIRQNRPAFIQHPDTGKTVWFNQILNFVLFQPVARAISKSLFGFRDTGVEFGDGSPITTKMRRQIFKVLKTQIINEPWQDNDIIVVDNIACLHGRARYRGKRRVTVGMFN